MIKRISTKLAELDIFIFTIFCIFAAIGFIGLIYDLCLLIKRKCFAKEYISKYKQLRRNDLFDEDCYQWLIHNVTRMESEMGSAGRIDFYRPPYANFAFQNYDALSNTLLNIRTPAIADLEATQVILERYIGALGYYISKKKREFLNPFICLKRSVRLVFDVLLWIPRSVGLININFENRIKNNSLSGKIVGLITFLGSLASIVSLAFILSDWDPLVKFLN
ncbi:hypothetical protein F4225_02295, partial [Candidatus Poribacteria bacterium]|nr:hypothetical protein [Candidatus Poribacteria bacterium]